MDKATSIFFRLHVNQEHADADDLDVIAHELAAVLRSDELDVRRPEGESKPPEGVRSNEVLSVGQIIVEIGPIAVPALAAALHTWIAATTKRRRVTVKVGDSSVEFDAKTTSPECLTQLGKLAQALRPK